MGNADSVPKNWGFKVIELVNQSPGQKAGLIVGSDFILTVNGRKLRRLTAEQIKDLVQSNEDQEATLKVLNIETGKIRELLITPTRKWPGDGLLGVKIRLAPYGDDLKKLEQTVAANQDNDFSYDDIYTSSEADNESFGDGAGSDNSSKKLSRGKSLRKALDPLGVFQK